MSLINIKEINIKNYKDYFLSPISLEIKLDCLRDINHDVLFRIVYVGDAVDSTNDQVLEELNIINLDKGEHLFELNVNNPNPNRISGKDNLLGVTVMIFTFIYRNQEFFRASYFVYNNFVDGYEDDNSMMVDINKVQRFILVDKPRMRIFDILWDHDTIDNKELDDIKLQKKNIKKTKKKTKKKRKKLN